MDKRRAALQKAEEAQQLVDALSPFWDEVETDIHKMWETSKSDQREAREDLYRELHGLRSVKARLESRLRAGRIAEDELKREKDGNRNP